MSLPEPGEFMRVECNNHETPWRIAQFHRLDGQWTEYRAPSKARRIEQKGKAAEVEALPPMQVSEGGDFDLDDFFGRMVPAGDRPSAGTHLVAGEPVDPLIAASRVPDPAEPQWETFDLTCPRCKRSRRHATYTRRADALFAIFDALVAHGGTRVTPELLHDYETRRHADGH